MEQRQNMAITERKIKNLTEPKKAISVGSGVGQGKKSSEKQEDITLLIRVTNRSKGTITGTYATWTKHQQEPRVVKQKQADRHSNTKREHDGQLDNRSDEKLKRNLQDR